MESPDSGLRGNNGAPRTPTAGTRDPQSSLPVSTVQALIDQWRAAAAACDVEAQGFGAFAFRLQADMLRRCADQLAALLASPSLQMQEKEEDTATRVDHTQYPSNPLATAASNEVGPLFVRDIARAVGLADDAEMDDVLRAVQSLEARATEAARKLRQSICVYCGEAAEHESPEARVLAMTDHTLACPKRPEQRLFAIIDGLRADVGAVLSEMDAYVLDEDRCGSDEEEYEALSAGQLPKWCDRIRNLLGQVYAIDGIRQGADYAGSIVPRTVNADTRDPDSASPSLHRQEQNEK